jgi:hypothetical protein
MIKLYSPGRIPVTRPVESTETARRFLEKYRRVRSSFVLLFSSTTRAFKGKLWPTSMVSGILSTFIETLLWALAEQKIQQHSKPVAILFILIREFG